MIGKPQRWLPTWSPITLPTIGLSEMKEKRKKKREKKGEKGKNRREEKMTQQAAGTALLPGLAGW
jgi:hypothetical protein